jgi:hypothetical protein
MVKEYIIMQVVKIDMTVNTLIIHASGAKYVGDWVDGKTTGEFLNNKFHGKGTVYWANGNKYVGDWVNNKQTGKGTCFYADGDKYVGDWLDDKRHGKGTFFYTDGDKVEGK